MPNKSASKEDKTIPVQLINREFIVQLKPPENQNIGTPSFWRLRILIAVIFIVIAYLFVLFWYVFPINTSPVQNIASDIGITYIAPKYLAVGDENIIEITLLNMRSSQSFSGIITLVFTDKTVSMTSIPDQRLSIPIDDLLPGDRLTRQFKLKLADKPLSNFIEFYFQLSLSNGPQFKSKIDSVSVSPIPRIRTTWLWFTGTSGLIGLFIIFIFDRLKNLMGFQK